MNALFGLIALILSHLGAPVGSSDCLAESQQVQRCSASVDTSTGDGGLGQAPDPKRISNGF